MFFVDQSSSLPSIIPYHDRTLSDQIQFPLVGGVDDVVGVFQCLVCEGSGAKDVDIVITGALQSLLDGVSQTFYEEYGFGPREIASNTLSVDVNFIATVDTSLEKGMVGDDEAVSVHPLSWCAVNDAPLTVRSIDYGHCCHTGSPAFVALLIPTDFSPMGFFPDAIDLEVAMRLPLGVVGVRSRT